MEPQILPTRIDLIAMLPQGTRIAEIGVWRAYFTTKMLDLPNLGLVYAIDSWKPRPEYHDPLAPDDHEQNLLECLHNLRGHIPGGRVRVVRMDSLDAAKSFKPGELDAVYIDADHSYEACLADLKAWSKIVTRNGYILGHDYTSNEQAKKWKFGVIEAVAEFCKSEGWHITHLTKEDFASYCLRANQ